MVDRDDLKCHIDREESLHQAVIGTCSLVGCSAQEEQKREA
jgi:hypothetical protein